VAALKDWAEGHVGQILAARAAHEAGASRS
jgi:hypothetical protein